MPNIVQGGNTGGLMRYLVGPGRANEHVKPHLVAGSGSIMRKWGDWEELSEAQAGEISERIDQYMNETGTYPMGAHKQWNRETEEMETVGNSRTPCHVFHCSLSLSGDEGKLSEETWAKIAHDFMREMGFDDGAHAPCQWVAIHHGVSKGGGDHIHIVANIVRENGTRWSPWQCFKHAQKACGQLEHRYGLRIVEGREHGRGSRCDSARAQKSADKRNMGVTERQQLEMKLRAAAMAARSEEEFVRIARSNGVQLYGRVSKENPNKIVGYSARLCHTDARYMAGGKIARDLALPRLRKMWGESPEQIEVSAKAWVPFSKRNGEKAPVVAGPWNIFSEYINEFRAIDPRDEAAIISGAQCLSGLYSAQMEQCKPFSPQAFRLMRASQTIGRIAQTKTHTPGAKQSALGASAVSSALTMGASALSRGRRQQLLLLYSALELTKALHDLLEQSGQTETALAVSRDSAELMASVQKQFAEMPQMTAYVRNELQGVHTQIIQPPRVTLKRAASPSRTSAKRVEMPQQYIPKRTQKRDQGPGHGAGME